MQFLRWLFASLCLVLLATTAKADDKPGDKKDDPKPETDTEKLAAALKREEDYKKEIETLKKPKPEPEGGDGLREKAAKEKADAEKNSANTKEIERALGFNMGIDAFVVENASLLPADIPAMVKLANKETYDSAVLKAGALKKAIIESYFNIQENVDALTAGQKATLDAFLKLTKNGKESKAADIYENVFEPALEMIRRIKKAEDVGRGRQGFASSDASNDAYKNRLVDMARKTHLGEKGV